MDAMPEERWLPVVGFEKYYEVSDQGRVRSLRDGRIMRPATHKAGYRMLGLSGGGQKISRQLHRIVLDAFVGPLPDGFVSCHNNGDPGDNRLENLRYDTPRANNLDKVRHGRDHNASKTHCHRGHEFTPENTIWDPPNNRRCRTCHRKVTREYQRRRRAAQKGEVHGST